MLRDASSIPWLGRFPERGHGNPLQDSCLGNPMDRGAWRAMVRGVTKKSDRTEHTLLYTTFCFNFFISWRLITLQYCSGFCHTLT